MPIVDQLHGAKSSRFREITDNEDTEGNLTNQGDVRRLRFDDESIIRETLRDPHSSIFSNDESLSDEYILSAEQQATSAEDRRAAAMRLSLLAASGGSAEVETPVHHPGRDFSSGSISSMFNTPVAHDRLLASGANTPPQDEEDVTAPAAAYLNLDTVLQGKTDYKLQSVEPFFTDPTGLYQDAFEKKLQKLDGKSSEGPLCVGEYLTASEKDWYSRFRDVKMGKSAASTPASSVFRLPLTRRNSSNSDRTDESANMATNEAEYNSAEQYLLNDDYKPPKGVSKVLMRRVGQWPVYSILLAFVSDGH